MILSDDTKTANAIGAKTARACDSCLIKRARWFCAADDAFLCQPCDVSVHSANQLASRHQRARLDTASFRSPEPAWHQGFTRKARTPRNKKIADPLPMVPELEVDAETYEEEEDERHLNFRVPILDPLANSELKADHHDCEFGLLDHLPEFDVEGLLEESYGKEAEDGGNDIAVCFEEKRVKVEDEEMHAVIASHLLQQDELDWSCFEFDYDSCGAAKQEDDDLTAAEADDDKKSAKDEKKKTRLLLKLDYEQVRSAWGTQGCPWTNGIRPNFSPHQYDLLVSCHGDQFQNPLGRATGRAGCDQGREARVSRYREKRRTRLFSKKIRYEVRKLNAEKRPRLKGRFVKRTSFAMPTYPSYLVNM